MSPFTAIRRSLSTKLLVIISAAVFLALTMSAIALTLYDANTYRERMAEEFTTLADMVARASGPGLVFNDKEAVSENLRLLHAHPKMVTGAVYNLKGDLFANSGAKQAPPPTLSPAQPAGFRVTGTQIVVSKPIVENGQRVGTAYLVGRYEARERIVRYIGILSIVMFISFLIAVIISLGLQRAISRPILEIAGAARLAAEKKDFSHRVEKKTSDEVGDLVNAFNTMLQEVGDRTRQIEAANRSLESEMVERRRTEAALRESEERFRVLADHAPVLVWLNDEHGCAFVNREYLRFTGRSMKDLVGTGWQDAIHPQDAGEYLSQYAAASRAHANFDHQHRFRRADGEYRWLKSVGVPRFTADGRFLGYVGCSVDITEIQKSIAELAAAEKALRAADRKKDEFLAVLSHELRNPLSPIRNAVAILRKSGKADEVSAWAHGVIERQVRQFARLLEDLLDASRIANGKLELRLERIELSEVIDMALETTRPIVEAAGHRLDVFLADGPIYVDGDAARLAQVLSNLLSNAVKYTDGQGRIRLGVERKDGEVRISVRDNGIGISRDMLPHVFEMFYQASDDPKRSGGGLGIGLAIVHGLVQKHGGRIEVDSAGLGKGSEFTVVLPVAAGPAAPAALPAHGAASPGKRLRILIADDIADARDTLAALLALSGHEVDEAADGAEALEKVLRNKPDLAILDIGMPGFSGYEAAESIRAHFRGNGPFLIALSGYGQAEDIARAKAAGFDRHLTKPVDIDALYRLLEEAILFSSEQQA